MAANILVGQALGGGDPDEAYGNGISAVLLGLAVVGTLGTVLFVGAGWIVGPFIDDAATASFAVDFLRAFAVAGLFIAGYYIFSGSLRGGSDTRSPFVATFVGSFVFLLGTSYVGGLHLGYGVVAAYVGIVADFAWRSVFVGTIYLRKNWIAYGTTLIDERRGAASPSDGPDD